MIIQVRGTSGSGKTTVMTEAKKAIRFHPVFVPGRKKPLFYVHGQLVLLGHYEGIACGGCDTIGSARQIYEVLHQYQTPEQIVLTEGLLWSEDVKWTLQLLEEGHEIRTLYLVTPVDVCLERIKARRKAKGRDDKFDEHRTWYREKVIGRTRQRLLDGGVDYAHRVGQKQAVRLIKNWISNAKV